MKVRTRFAPSPTGFLHIGGVRTALYNYLLAKQNGGEFILRLEDTDRERFVEEGISQIVEGLGWLGLEPDEGFWMSEGRHQNIEYIQSERNKTGLYEGYARQLVERGLAYHSYIAPQKYQEYKSGSKNMPFVYRKDMESELHTGDNDHRADNHPIRLDIKSIQDKFPKLRSEGLLWKDEIRGEFVEDLNNIEDFILIKSDGFPTYNFANVIDDYEMKISHILRGDEFVSSTGKHALLYEIFGWQRPKFVHLSVINGPDGKKLSKRTGDTNVLDYRDKGYLPEALLNFLALLGWNDGTEQEIFALNELTEKFSLERLNTSPAIFDQKRLDWMNGYWIRRLDIGDLARRSENFWPPGAENTSESHKRAILMLVQERLKYLGELPELTGFFFGEPKPEDVFKLYRNPTDKQLKKTRAADYPKFLRSTIAALEESDFSEGDISQRLNDLLDKLATRPGILFALIRIAISGSPSSPQLFGTLAVLGKDKSLSRLKKAVEGLEP